LFEDFDWKIERTDRARKFPLTSPGDPARPRLAKALADRCLHHRALRHVRAEAQDPLLRSGATAEVLRPLAPASPQSRAIKLRFQPRADEAETAMEQADAASPPPVITACRRGGADVGVRGVV